MVKWGQPLHHKETFQESFYSQRVRQHSAVERIRRFCECSVLGETRTGKVRRTGANATQPEGEKDLESLTT